MNREIKFKIWADNKFYNKCLIGNTNNIDDENWTCPMVWLEKQKEWVNCDNGIICQYTGLCDKNEKEIYEGDIVRTFKGDICVVEYNYNEFGLKVIDKSKCYGWVDFIDYKIEVIGNKYDNPELLEGE